MLDFTEEHIVREFKLPRLMQKLAPKGVWALGEHSWNVFPYCRTIVTNPLYMKDNFYAVIDSYYAADNGTSDN
ncbi:phosphatidylinositol transfer protein beta isoform, partial [Elysia marginata]